MIVINIPNRDNTLNIFSIPLTISNRIKFIKINSPYIQLLLIYNILNSNKKSNNDKLINEKLLMILVLNLL